MFPDRRQYYYQSQQCMPPYTQAQIQQYRNNVLATRAKLQAYKEAIIEAELQSRNNENVTFVGGTMMDSPEGAPPPVPQEFTPCGHVSRAGSTPQSYSLWGSSGDSNTDSLRSHRKRFGRNLCRIVTGCTAVVVFLAVVAVVGVAFYLGYMSFEDEGPHYTDKYMGNLRILQGDSWMKDLMFNDSPAFRAKASKYKNMIRSVFENSVLGPAFEIAYINQFTNMAPEFHGFQLTFQLNLDRRKIPFWHLKDTEVVIQKILEQELESLSPIAFHNLKVDFTNLDVKKLDPKHEGSHDNTFVQQTPPPEMEEEFEVVPLGSKGGLLKIKTSKVSEEVKENIREILTPKRTTTQRSKATNVENEVHDTENWKPFDPINLHDSSAETRPSIREESEKQTKIQQVSNYASSGETRVIEAHGQDIGFSVVGSSMQFNNANFGRDPLKSSTTTKLPSSSLTTTRSTTDSTTSTSTTTLSTTSSSTASTSSSSTSTSTSTISAPSTPISTTKNTTNRKPSTDSLSTIKYNYYNRTFNPSKYDDGFKPMAQSDYNLSKNKFNRESTHQNFVMQSTTPSSKEKNIYITESIASKSEQNSIESNFQPSKPSIRDIQSILENLLYLATIKPNLLLNKVAEEKALNENKSDFVSKESSTTATPATSPVKDYNEKKTSKSPSPPLSTSYSGVRDVDRMSVYKNEGFPADRFRNPAMSQFTTSSTTEGSLSIWDIMTTKKPLILDTEIVTSTSYDVSYGNAKNELHPVYVHSGKIRNKPKAHINHDILSNVVIPVISGKEVRYIQINRTRQNYPKVVVVNIPNVEEESLHYLNPTFVAGEEGREININSQFIDKVSDLLETIKHQNSSENAKEFIKENIDDHYEPEILSSENQEATNSTSSVWNALSNLSKIYQNQSAISEKNYSSFHLHYQNYDGVPWTPIYNESNNKNDADKMNTSSDRTNFGKSLKPRTKITIYILGSKDGRTGKVVSYSDSSMPSLTFNEKNSPIHTFTFTKGQSLDELLTEIIEVISKQKTPKSETKSKPENDKPSGFAHKNSTNMVDTLSNVLMDYYKKYNIGPKEHIPNTNITKNFSDTNTVLRTGEDNQSTDNLDILENSIFSTLPSTRQPTTAKATESTTVVTTTPTTTTIRSTMKAPTEEIVTVPFHYHHQLFPVMTRPMNPISTTPNTISEVHSLNSITGESFKTSLDVSYSMITGNRNVSFPIRHSLNAEGCMDEEFKCDNGKCIPSLARCNMVRDCADNSDEMLCNCSDILLSQHYKRKICDGIIDCWDKSDETDCDWCSSGQFLCTGYQKCIEPSLVCDGVANCPNGDDERDCVTVAPNIIGANSIDYHDEGYLLVRQRGIWGKLCIENFDNAVSEADLDWSVADLGEAVCNTLTFGSSSKVERAYDSSPPIFRSISPKYFEVNISRDLSALLQPRALEPVGPHQSRKRSLSGVLSNSIVAQPYLHSLRASVSTLNRELTQLTQKSRVRRRDVSHASPSLQFQNTHCMSKDVVKVKCDNLQCGIRPRASTQQARIVGGSNSSPGAWPWHAALYKEGEYQCGGTLISADWLISAGHCFYSSRESYWVARLGALRRGTKFPSPFEQAIPLSHIFIHPEYVSQGFINDISVVRLRHPVNQNDYVRPVCLPPPGAAVNDGQRCTLVGWGQLFEVKKVFPDTLQEVEVPLISTKECRKRTLFLPLYRITEDMFCAGYDRGGRDACLGDSGGPLMCQRDDGRWEVMGVTSNGYGCARPHRPGVYTKVVNYVSWINQILELSSDERVKPIQPFCEGHRCPLGECIPLSGICNGRAECSDRSDEANC